MSAQSEAVKRTFHTKLTLIRRYKVAVGCMRCGERRLPALDLHHRYPDEKHKHLTRPSGVTGGDRWKRLSYLQLVDELGKCDVVCANCHRVQRYEDEGWAKITPIARERDSRSRMRLEAIVLEAERTGLPVGS